MHVEQQPRAEQFARSDYVRNLLENEFFERQLTSRLIEIATEGRGAVINAWEPPEEEASEDEETETTETGAEISAVGYETAARPNAGDEADQTIGAGT